MTPRGAILRAARPAGLFYAAQTLRQLAPVGAAATIPCVEIEDQPRFPWRGFMLDDCRHFQGLDTVKLLLDIMALHKLNVFHWHLTEDQGWRVQIDRYPELTRVGSFRKGTMAWRGAKPDGVPHGGFYTQDQVRDVVAYAAARSITIVPEIEIPGHSLSALAAYPWLGCAGGPYEVWDRIGIQPDIMCAGKDTTFEFLEGVLDEIVGLFPGPWVHIGGDEAPKARWETCPDCRARMARERIATTHDLQGWMTNKVAAFLRSRSKGTIAWSDSVGPSLDPDIRIQYWRFHEKELAGEMRKGRQVIGSAFMETYLDHGYAITPLRKAYAYDPVLPEVGSAEASSVVGIEAPLWTEMVPDRPRLWFQVFPRLCAYAETGWTSAARKDWRSFQDRLPGLLGHIGAMGGSHASLSAAASGPLRRLFGYASLFQEQKGRAY